MKRSQLESADGSETGSLSSTKRGSRVCLCGQSKHNLFMSWPSSTLRTVQCMLVMHVFTYIMIDIVYSSCK